MQRISYAEQVFGTDERLAELVLHYATLLARTSSADTIVIPGRIGTGDVEPISLLLGPASQITAWEDDEPFDGDVGAALEDVARRIRGLESTIPTSAEDPLPVPDEFDDLG